MIWSTRHFSKWHWRVISPFNDKNLQITKSYIDKHLKSFVEVIEVIMKWLHLVLSVYGLLFCIKSNSSISVNIHLTNHAKVWFRELDPALAKSIVSYQLYFYLLVKSNSFLMNCTHLLIRHCKLLEGMKWHS